MTTCDVLVIGAGPAGSQAARHAALGGADTVFVERRRVVGVPVQCAEHVPLLTLSALPRPQDVVVQRITHLRTQVPGLQTEALRAPGAIVRRDLFDQQLAEAAQEAGARLWLRTRAVDWRDGAAVVDGPGGRRLVRAKVVIGADGPRSRVRGWTGGGAERFVHAAQVRLPWSSPWITPCAASGATSPRAMAGSSPVERTPTGDWAWIPRRGWTSRGPCEPSWRS